MSKKIKQTLAKRQGYWICAKLTLEEYVKLDELVVALGTNRSAWISEIIQANLAMQKNIGTTAQPPPGGELGFFTAFLCNLLKSVCAYCQTPD